MTEKSMTVKMKGVGNSLWVTIDPDPPVEQVKTELINLFEPLKHMAHATNVVLDVGVYSDDNDRYRQIHAFLKETYRLKRIESPQKKELRKEKRTKMKSNPNTLVHPRNDTLVLSGRIRSGQTVQAKKHLVIMGDVNPGCEIIAGGDIIILGSLMGTASAGQPNNGDAIIIALDFRPLQVSIGGVVAAGLPGSKKSAPEFAQLEDGTIVVDDYLKTNPFKRLPWPTIR